MGACGSANFGKLKDNSARFDIQPDDTQSLKTVSLPSLAFYILLSDIKIKRCSYDFMGLRFKIEGIHKEECLLKELDGQQRAYWKHYTAFQFKASQYEIRKKFLEVEAVNLRKQVIGTLRINLYLIWTGPYHLDFSLPLKDCPTSRLSFNFKISQGIHFKLQNLATELVPNHPNTLPQRLTYTLSAVIGQKTEPSPYVYSLILGEENPNAKLAGEWAAGRQVGKEQKIKWENSQDWGQLPSFEETIPFFQIYESSLHLHFWRVESGVDESRQPRYESEGECFISLNKLMTLEYSLSKDAVSHIQYLNRNILLSQKVLLHGKEQGIAHIQFRFAVQAHQKQMQACVRTEDGVLTSSPVFLKDNSQKLHECEEIAALKKLHNQIQKEFISLDQECSRRNSFITKKEIVLRIYSLLQRKLALVQKTHKESILFYSYQDAPELVRAQRFLINFAFNILTYIHEDIAALNDICWNILAAILQRGEFKLTHMAFSSHEKLQLRTDATSSNTASSNTESMRHKSETSLKYLQLLNELLKETLRALAIKGNQCQQVFAQKFCAYAYFRIPLFRERILQMLRNAKDPEIEEWRGSENNLYRDESIHDLGINDDFYDSLFDWENNFLKPLSHSNPLKYKESMEKLQQTLLEDRWEERLARRGGAFYTFLQNLLREIEYVCVVSKHIRWHYLPGYNRLLQAFLVEMKLLKVKDYSERFKRCCLQLLANEKLLNIFVVILLGKTNVNDGQTVHAALELIDSMFKSLKKNHRPIPSTFDYRYLMQGIIMLLNSQLEFSIQRALLLLYDNFQLFSQEFTLQLGLYIMANFFHKFFFHWSYNLRHIFQTLLYTRILRPEHNHSPLKGSTQSSYITGLKVALRQYQQNLVDHIGEQVGPQTLSSNADHFYEKELYKKMKGKLKRRAGNTLRSSISAHLEHSQKNQEEVPDHLPPSKSAGTNVNLVLPNKLIFFKEEDMTPKSAGHQNLAYAKVALEQYKQLVQEMRAKEKIDPEYAPEMRVKRILDEVEFRPLAAEEW